MDGLSTSESKFLRAENIPARPTQWSLPEEIDPDLPVVYADYTKNLFNKSLYRAAKLVPRYLWTLAPEVIKKIARVKPIHYEIKIALWDDFENAAKEDRHVKVGNICTKTCSIEYYYKLLKRHEFVVWLLTPPKNYDVAMRAMLERSLERVEEIIEMDIKDDKGKVSSKRAGILLSACKDIQDRAKGQAVQRAEILKKQLSISISDKKDTTSPTDKKALVHDIDRKLRALEAKMLKKQANLIQYDGEAEK